VAYDRRVTEIVHAAGGRVHVHCHGSIASILDGFIELGADVIHPFEAPPSGDVTPRQAKEALRGKVALEGNIQISDMYTKSAPEIRSQVQGLIRDVFDDHTGLILCASASPYRVRDGDLCRENYRAMVEEVLAYAG
jgi:uroporphyrinogen-III decarboxylase